MIEVFLREAIACIAMVCHPVLVGDDTPTGTFDLVPMYSPRYGVVMAFAQDEAGGVYSLHHVPSARQHLISGDRRIGITLGCINSPPALMAAARRQKRITIHE
jgi:hypothetical protein